MKTLIVYGSTYGYTEDCANFLARHLKGDVNIVNIVTGAPPPLDDFENIIIGGSIYIGRIQRQIIKFCKENAKALAGKRVSLFICGGLPEGLDQYFKESFPKELLDAAIAKEYFGGELRHEKIKPMHRLMAKAVKSISAKAGKTLASPMPKNITKLAEIINQKQG